MTLWTATDSKDRFTTLSPMLKQVIYLFTINLHTTLGMQVFDLGITCTSPREYALPRSGVYPPSGCQQYERDKLWVVVPCPNKPKPNKVCSYLILHSANPNLSPY